MKSNKRQLFTKRNAIGGCVRSRRNGKWSLATERPWSVLLWNFRGGETKLANTNNNCPHVTRAMWKFVRSADRRTPPSSPRDDLHRWRIYLRRPPPPWPNEVKLFLVFVYNCAPRRAKPFRMLQKWAVTSDLVILSGATDSGNKHIDLSLIFLRFSF